MPARPKYPENLSKENDGLSFNSGLDNCKLSGVPSGTGCPVQMPLSGVIKKSWE
jgi:hypothetical protein